MQRLTSASAPSLRLSLDSPHPHDYCQTEPTPNHIVCQISQAMTSFECMRFYASLLWFDFMAKF